MNSRTQNQLISRILKSRESILDYSFTDLKVDVGREDELVQHYDSLTYLEEQDSCRILKNLEEELDQKP